MTEPAPDKIVSMMDFLAYGALLDSQIPEEAAKEMDAWSEKLSKAAGKLFTDKSLDIWKDEQGTPYLRASTLRNMFNTAAKVTTVPENVRNAVTAYAGALVDMLPDHTSKLPKLKKL